MHWYFVLILSMLNHHVMAVCPVGEQYSGTVCITEIKYYCAQLACWESEISFDIVNTDSVAIHTSPTFTTGSFNSMEPTSIGSCSTSFTINFFDSFNDGWHGAKISIYGTTNGGNDNVKLKEIGLDNGQGSGVENILTTCGSCPTGYYKASESSSPCTSCSAGTYAESQGSVSCDGCATGTYALAPAATSSAVCKICGGDTKVDVTISWYKMGTPTPADNEVGWLITDTDNNQLFYDNNYRATPTTIEMNAQQPFRFHTWSKNSASWMSGMNFYSVNMRSSNKVFNLFKFHTDGAEWRYYEFSGILGATSCTCSAGYKLTAGSPSCTPCTAGYYSAGGSALTCDECAAGKYSGATGSTSSAACTECPGGFKASAGSSSCTPCNAGYYSASEAGDCTECLAGKYSASKAITCTDCSEGKYSSALAATSSAVCTDCPAGFKASAGSSSCTPCTAGYYSASGAEGCIGCSQGKYSTSGAASCTDCPAGFDASADNSPSCSACSLGKFAYKANTNTCSDCQKGTYQDQTNSESCKSCPTGKVLNSKGQSSVGACVSCDAGKASNQLIKEIRFECHNSVNCYHSEISWELTSENGTPLQSGGYSNGDAIPVDKYAYKIIFKDSYGDGWNGAYVKILTQSGYLHYFSPSGQNVSIVRENDYVKFYMQTTPWDETLLTFLNPNNREIKVLELRFERAECAECLVGYYSEPVSETCTECPAGEFTDVAGLSTCKSCPVGYYSVQAGSETCTECPAGEFTDVAGLATCKSCPVGYKQSASGQNSCTVCTAGQSSTSDFTDCEGCLTGEYSSNAGACIECTNGYTTWDVTFTFRKYGSPLNIDAQWFIMNEDLNTKLYGDFLSPTDASPVSWAGYRYETATMTFRTDERFYIYSYSNDTANGWETDNSNKYVLAAYSKNGIFKNYWYNHKAGGYTNWRYLRPLEGDLARVGGEACVCPPGTYIDGTSCSLCDAGKYSPVSSTAECHECPIATYSSQGATSCSSCSSGKTTLQVSSVQSQCVECSEGRYAKPMGKCIQSIQFTTAGSYQYEVRWTLTSLNGDSLHGVYNASEVYISGNYDTLILEDTYGDGWNGNKLKIKYCDDTYATELDFVNGNSEIGTYVGISALNEITFENPPTTSSKTTTLKWLNFEECVTCAAGTYSDVLHISQCQQCPEGRAIEDDGGTASLHDAIDDCQVCPAGTEFMSSTECKICSAGQYSPEVGGTCQQCPEGRYIVDQGSPSRLNHDSVDDCLWCPTGTEFVDRSTACRQCPIGQIQPYSGPSAKCRQCPFGETTTEEGASECVETGKQVFTGIFRACLLDNNAFVCWGRDDIPIRIGFKAQGPNALNGHVFCPTPLKNALNCSSWYGMDFYWDIFNRNDVNVYNEIRTYVSDQDKTIRKMYLLGQITCVLFRDQSLDCWSANQAIKTFHLAGVQSVFVKQSRNNYVADGTEWTSPYNSEPRDDWLASFNHNSRYGQFRTWEFKQTLCVIVDYTPSCYDVSTFFDLNSEYTTYSLNPLTPAEMPTWPTYNKNLIESEDYIRGGTFIPVKGIVSIDIETSNWVSWWGTYYEPKISESTCTEGYTDLQCCYEYIAQIGWSSGSFARPGYRDYFGTSLFVADWGDVLPYGCFLALDINGRVIGGGRSYFNTNLLTDGIDDSVWQAKRWTTAGGYDQKYVSKQEEMLGSLTAHDMQWTTPTFSFVHNRPWIVSEATTYTMPHQDSSAQRMYGDCVQRVYSRITCKNGIDVEGELVGFSPNEENRVVYYQNVSDNTVGYIIGNDIFKSNVTVKGAVSVGIYEACSISLGDEKVICWTNPNIDLTFVSRHDSEETWTFTDISNPILNEPTHPYVFLGSGKCIDKTNEQGHTLSVSSPDPIEECMNKCGTLTGGFYLNTARDECFCVQENCVPLGRRIDVPVGVDLESGELGDKLDENRQWDSYVKRVVTLEYTTKTDMHWQPHSPTPFEYIIDGCDDDDKDGVCNDHEVMGCTRPKSCTWQEHFTESPPKGHYHECGYPFDSVNYECHPNERGKYRLDDLTDTWVRNPGRCVHGGGDNDDNGWCDELDEIIGCLDIRACNYDGCLDTNACPRIIGDICEVNADCMSEQCTWCNGAYRCTLPPENPGDKLSCNRNSVTNMDYITRHNANFCRMPYGRSFKCTLFNRQFSSMKGVPIENAANKTYLSMTPENRKKMIRCLNVDDRCENIDELQCDSDDDTKFYPRNVCCQCGGGRVFDTSRGEPLYDRDNNEIADEREELQCNDPNACNFDPTSGHFASNKTCKYNDDDNDGICDDLYEKYTLKCGIFGATNYKENLLDNEAYDNSVCIFPETSQTCLVRPYYKAVFGCMDNFACDYNFAATQSTGQCTYIQPRKTCEGEHYHVIEQCFMTDSDILNGDVGTCTGVFFDGESCSPTCDSGYQPSTTNVTCENGGFTTFSCTFNENCIGPAVGQYVSSPCTHNTTTVLSNCSTPNNGQYVSSPCIPGNPLENGTNAVIQDCSTPQTGQYVEQKCSHSDDTQFSACSVHNIIEKIITPCIAGNASEIGQNTLLTNKTCTELHQDYLSTTECTSDSYLLKQQWNSICSCVSV